MLLLSIPFIGFEKEKPKSRVDRELSFQFPLLGSYIAETIYIQLNEYLSIPFIGFIRDFRANK